MCRQRLLNSPRPQQFSSMLAREQPVNCVCSTDRRDWASCCCACTRFSSHIRIRCVNLFCYFPFWSILLTALFSQDHVHGLNGVIIARLEAFKNAGIFDEFIVFNPLIVNCWNLHPYSYHMNDLFACRHSIQTPIGYLQSKLSAAFELLFDKLPKFGELHSHCWHKYSFINWFICG